MTTVTVLGLGEMGAALAGALLTRGFKVTVWNRTPGKADALLARGAGLASDVASAISASEVIVVCVSDYTATEAMLAVAGMEAAASGRVIVQLSTGIPGEARRMGERIEALGAGYVDGAILAWPRQIGHDATILVSGDGAAIDRSRPVLDALAGNLVPMGAEVGASAALFSAVLAYLAGHWIGFAYGVALAEAEGIGAETFGDTLAAMAPVLGQDNSHMGKVVSLGLYGDPESTLRTAGADIARLVRHAADLNLNPVFPEFASRIFADGVEHGYGPEEHVALAKLFMERGPGRRG